MITVKENTTFVGVSELRTKIDRILEEAGRRRVLIAKRNKPVAVLLGVENYEKIERILDALEDVALGYLASERERDSKPGDYLDINEVEKRIKVK